MVDTFCVDINGQPHTWAFNNYALVELPKLLLQIYTPEELDGVSLDPSSITPLMMRLAEENYILAISLILYCGFVGYELSMFNRKHGLTPQIVSKWMGDGSAPEVLECWKLFLKVTGVSDLLVKFTENISDENKDSEKKKKPLRGKKSMNTQ